MSPLGARASGFGAIFSAANFSVEALDRAAQNQASGPIVEAKPE